MSSLKSAEDRIDALEAAGYEHIVGIFVDIPAEKSVERALARYRRGMELHRNGVGDGGRLGAASRDPGSAARGRPDGQPPGLRGAEAKVRKANDLRQQPGWRARGADRFERLGA